MELNIDCNFGFKLSTKEQSLGNFFTVYGCFNCVTSHVKVLGWLERKVRRRKKAESIRLVLDGNNSQTPYVRIGRHPPTAENYKP